MAVLEVDDLRRSYVKRSGVLRRRGATTEAVKGVSFSVEQGELFGLLGPNGAGKTTTIKVLITLLLPSGGSAKIFGHDVVSDAREVRRRVGYVFGGDRGLYDRLSGLDNLRYFADLFGVDVREQRTRIPSLLELVGLSGRENERVEGYSRGMRQRLHIARGLIHNPDMIFLDEPSIGVDPVGARELRSAISMLREHGKTVLLTTHYMFEADELCDRIAVIADGQLVAQDTPAGLKERVDVGNVLEVEVFGVDDELVTRAEALPGVRAASLQSTGPSQLLQVHTEPGHDVTVAALSLLNGLPTGKVTHRQPTLEDAYVELVSRR